MGRQRKTSDYYQFPLCLLSLPLSEKELVQHLISYVHVEKGAILRKKIEQGAENVPGYEILTEMREDQGLSRMDEIIGMLRRNGRLPADFDADDPRHLSIAAIIYFHENIQLGSCRGDVSRFDVCKQHESDFVRVAGRDVEVRIRFDLMWQLHHGGLSLREFRVLAGLYAGIGSYPYAAVPLKRLRYLSAGFKSAEAHDEALDLLPTAPRLLSIDQLRKTRDDLVRLRLVYSYHDGRKCWYSNRMSDEEIMQRRTAAKAHKLKAEIRKYQLREESLEQTSGLEAELASAKSRMRQKREKNGPGDSSAGIPLDRLPALNVGGDGK